MQTENKQIARVLKPAGRKETTNMSLLKKLLFHIGRMLVNVREGLTGGLRFARGYAKQLQGRDYVALTTSARAQR